MRFAGLTLKLTLIFLEHIIILYFKAHKQITRGFEPTFLVFRELLSLSFYYSLLVCSFWKFIYIFNTYNVYCFEFDAQKDQTWDHQYFGLKDAIRKIYTSLGWLNVYCWEAMVKYADLMTVLTKQYLPIFRPGGGCLLFFFSK